MMDISNFPMPRTRQARDQLTSDLRSLAKDAELLLEATMQDMTDNITNARKQLQAFTDRMMETCDDLQERSAAYADSAVKQTDEVVRTHPYESIGIAFGIGVLIGLVFGRK